MHKSEKYYKFANVFSIILLIPWMIGWWAIGEIILLLLLLIVSASTTPLLLMLGGFGGLIVGTYITYKLGMKLERFGKNANN